MSKHCVVRTDLMSGTKQPADLVSVKYMAANDTATAIDNGNFVKLDGLMAGEREVFKGVTPAVDTPIEQVVLVATPEVMYDERLRNLDDFVNEAGGIARGYRLRSGNIFSITVEGLDREAVVGEIVSLSAGTKLTVTAAGAGGGSTLVGTVIAIDKTGRYTYYVIQIA